MQRWILWIAIIFAAAFFAGTGWARPELGGAMENAAVADDQPEIPAPDTDAGVPVADAEKKDTPSPAVPQTNLKSLKAMETVTAKSVDSPHVNLSFNNTAIADALKMIAKQTGLRFEIEENVRGRITIDLKDINVWDALKIILDANRLAYYEDNGVILIMTDNEFRQRYGYEFEENEEARVIRLSYADPVDVVVRLNDIKSPTGRVLSDNLSNTVVLLDSPEFVTKMQSVIEEMDVPIETEVFTLKFAKAQDVLEKLKIQFPAIAVNMKIDPRAETITLTDTAANINSVRGAVKQLDIKRKITFEIDVIRIVLSEEHINGIDWEAIVSDYHRLDETGTEEFGKNNYLSIGTVTREDYPVLKEALETVGDMKVFEEPDLVVNNKDQGSIFMKSTPSGVNVTTASPVVNLERIKNADNFIDLTQAFQITPVVDGDVMDLTIRPISKDPKVDQAKLELQKDDVVIIGSIFQEQSNTEVGKFPLLGDLPILGFVFRSQHTEVLKLEHIIILKPKIEVISAKPPPDGS